ncbi:MAG: ABC-ATPase domain-containing protein [Anaerolineae bacterium]|nr:ABC-ATPase domain-containing protein [Anaerolineae bacterium]MDW8098115.1 ABC-ATPase domain-containing protein [Anaerolineae bacterium]
MPTQEDLRETLRRLDGRGYPAYKDLASRYEFPNFTLFIDHVQGDPFAAPSRLRVRVPQSIARFGVSTFTPRSREIALRDFLCRRFAAACRQAAERRGSGHSGLLAMDMPGQEILERTAVLVTADWVEARFVAGLPAAGRRILGRQAIEMLCEDLPLIVEQALLARNQPKEALLEHLRVAEDADILREQLDVLGLVAFVADGAILPRRSGVDDRPLDCGAIPFTSPESLRVTVELPHAGRVTGMGIPRGVTLIVGGGYHGKSTLLSAIERGVYNHIPGDGRERVVTHPAAVKVRAEDGRRIAGVDISPFIANLPFGIDTRCFTTDNASGSTSQAANIIEALEAGARVLLVDEDTAATNFMIRDHRMQELIAKEHEPITPFIDKVRLLYEEYGVSTILVMGGSGDYFDVADTVIAMEEYRPWDATARAKEIARRYAAERRPEGGPSFGVITPRIPLPDSIDPSKGRREVSLKARGLKTILFGREEIDLSAVEQLVDDSQVRAIAQALYYARERYIDGRRTLAEVLDAVMADIERGGLDVLDPRQMGDYAWFRRFELAAALNRLRTLQVKMGISAVQTSGQRCG